MNPSNTDTTSKFEQRSTFLPTPEESNNNNIMFVEPSQGADRIRSLRSPALSLRVGGESTSLERVESLHRSSHHSEDAGSNLKKLVPSSSATDATKKSCSHGDMKPQKPTREMTPKRRTKPRRQSGIICHEQFQGRKTDRPDTVRNMMVLMRTNSDRRILRNTLERKLRNTKRVAAVPSDEEEAEKQQ